MTGHHGYNESFSRSVAPTAEPSDLPQMDEPDLSWASQDDPVKPEETQSTVETPTVFSPIQPDPKEEDSDQLAAWGVNDQDNWLTGQEETTSADAPDVQPHPDSVLAPPSLESDKKAAAQTHTSDAVEAVREDIDGSDVAHQKRVAAVQEIQAETPGDAVVPTSEDTPEELPLAAGADAVIENSAPSDVDQDVQTIEPGRASHTESGEPDAELHEQVQPSAEPDPFGDSSDDWLKETGLKQDKSAEEVAGGAEATEPVEASHVEGDPVESNVANTGDEDAEDLDDEWAKALGGGDATGEDAWAALGDELDEEDGFLDDEPVQQLSSEPASRKASYMPTSASTPAIPLPTSTAAMATPAAYTPQPIQQQQAPKGQNGKPMKFFEELPMTAPKRASRPKPQQMVSTPPPPPSVSAMPPPAGKPMGPTRTVSQQYGSFVPPPRLDPFPPQPSVQPLNAAPQASSSLSTPPVPPAASSRYSPAVPSRQPSVSKYAAGPAAPAAPPANYSPSQNVTSQPAQPTSTTAPLAPPPKPNARYSPAPSASSGVSSGQSASQMKPSPAPYTPPGSSSGPPPSHKFAPRTSSPLAYTHALPERTLSRQGSDPNVNQLMSPSSTQSSQGPQTDAAGPRRASTQSPEAFRSKYAPGGQPSSGLARSASVADVVYQPTQHHTIRAAGHSAEPPNESYLSPQDGTEHDPLQRWKGSPILRFAPNGSVVSMLPKAAPRYGSGQATPMLKPTAGEVRVQKFADLATSDPIFDAFPGPLKGAKGKKKELVAWMSSRIEALQRESEHASIETLDPRIEERVLLWQVMKALVEHDGVLSGNPAVDLAVRQIIAPDNLFTGGVSTSSIPQPDIEPAAVQELSSFLRQGDREKAVWHAVDHKMWAHAMLIASTLNPSVWKQVVQEFVRNEVRKMCPGNQSMAALYNVFAQNWEESIEELVPVSARAGFQMVSTAGSSQPQDVLDGLNRWKETLGLVLLNRSVEDEKALHSLGKLLAGYGRFEAAHVCFIFSRSASVFAGPDDPTASFSLVGTNLAPTTKTPDLDSIILSEVYEYALTLSGKSQVKEIPHLQAFKVNHAYALIESGSRDKASQYCESVAAAVGSTTKRSPYYNPALASELQNLARRLSQMPNDSSSSWTSRPSMEKFTGKMWSSFNKFVAGDDPDAVSNQSSNAGEAEVGPFARVAGTPTISRSPSGAELYGMGQSFVPAAAQGVSTRYAPSAAPAAAAQQRSAVYNPYAPSDSPGGSYGTPPGPSNYRPASQQSNYAPHYTPMQPASDGLGLSGSKEQSYIPTAIPEEGSGPGPTSIHSPAPSSVDAGGSPYVPSPAMSMDGDNEARSSGYAPVTNGFPPRTTSYAPPGPNSYGAPGPSFDEPANDDAERSSGYEPSGGYSPGSGGYAPPAADYNAPTEGFEPQGSGYEPSAGGYEPPSSSYVPYEPEPDSPDDAPKPRKKMFGDDDDDDDAVAKQAAALKSQEKARKDREADEAFRKAAEEDAKRDSKDKRASGGWFGGLWGKKDANAPTVHRAKLGEENAFVYDPETKRWVNKKAGAEQTPASAPTPPPPKMGPPMSRTASSGGPPMGSTPPPMGGPPSRAGTPARSEATGSISDAPPSLQHIAGGPNAPVAAPPSGPPSRPPTSMSNASSIDDLLGAPTSRKGTAKKGKKGGRYVDVMAK